MTKHGLTNSTEGSNMHATNGQNLAGRWKSPSHAGWALENSASLQRFIADALEVSPATVSRYISEDRGPVTGFYTLVEKLAVYRKSDAGHVIGGAFEAAVAAVSGDLSVDEIRARLYNALMQETRAQAEEDRAEHRVAVALGRTSSPDASPEDFAELSAALDEHEHATRDETGWHLTALAYNRALRKMLAPTEGPR